MGKNGGVGGRGGRKERGVGAPHRSVDDQGTHVPLQTALFILIYLIFRSKLILAFNNLSRTEKSLRSLFTC